MVQFPFGMGKVTYLGWQWDGNTPGDEGGGWFEALDLAIRDTMMWADKEPIYDIPFKTEVVDTDGFRGRLPRSSSR